MDADLDRITRDIYRALVLQHEPDLDALDDACADYLAHRGHEEET